MFDPTLGQLMQGTQLARIPPNTSPQEQAILLNQIIEILNNYSRDVVASGPATITLLAGESSVVESVPHHLGYKPQAFAYLHDISISVGGVLYPSENFALPTYTSAGPDGAGHILFTDWVDYIVDETNINFHWNSGVTYGVDQSLDLNYYLTRLPA